VDVAKGIVPHPAEVCRAKWAATTTATSAATSAATRSVMHCVQ
jgi:hypothetical protein